MASPPASVEEIAHRATPRPWQQEAFGTGCGIFGPAPAHHHLASASSPTIPIGQNLANAALIVAAVNERDALLSDRAAMAERVAGLERERDDARYELSRFKDAISKRPDYEMHWEEASARADASEAEVARLREALEFYAEPETYHGVAFMLDPPGGGWAEDFDYDAEYERDMPGKLARAALTRPDDPTKET